MATVTQTPTPTLQMIPLAKIKSSPMNPRKTFDTKSLTELADSIESRGELQPITVRPDGQLDSFEVVMGDRRFRAAKMAGLKEIPAIVSPMSNADALEVMVIENLQREDVHPMEEAAGYQALLNKLDTCSECKSNVRGGHRLDCPRRNEVVREHTVDSIAAKVGKSVSYIYQRLKLATLIQFAAEVFREGLITAGHAILIARLQPQDQERALRACFDEHGYHSKLSIGELIKESLDEYGSGLMAEKDLRIWIQENINLDLKHAAWDLADAALVPEAGACTKCPKRTGTNPALFADMVDPKVKDVCTDPDCFKKKQNALVQVKAAQLADKAKPVVRISEKHSYTRPKEGAKLLRAGQWAAAKAGSCKDVATGLLVDGEKAGTTYNVCPNMDCKEHRRHYIQESRKPQDPVKAKEHEAAEEKKEKLELAVRRKAFELMVHKIDGVSRIELELIFECYVEFANVWDHKELIQLHGWKGSNPEKLLREKLHSLPLHEAWPLMIEILLWPEVQETSDYHTPLFERALGAYKIDLKKIEKELTAAAEKKATPQTSAKPKPKSASQKKKKH